MAVSSEALRKHLDYTQWASQRLLSAAAQLSRDELTRDFGTADRSVLGTLSHLFLSDRVWLARVTGAPRPDFHIDVPLAELQSVWKPVQDGWLAWAQTITDEAVLEELSYQDLKGRPWKQPLWQVLLHVVNHGTHHRGQVAGFLRAMGRVPPPLDLIFYFRERTLS
jgi:uncharacterized damage-inducible protein DinB